MVRPTSLPIIQLTDCSLILDGQVVLEEVSFALRAGERWALVGPNGSGKTLLLKMLRGDVWPTPTGRERRVYRLDDFATSKERIAYVGPERQDKYVRYGWNLTVEQVVLTGLFDEDIPLTTPTRAQREKVEGTLRRFGLLGLRNRRLLTLSYGQRRLALVARAFASPARVLLLDEVFNGLDTKTRRRLQAALERPRGGHEWVLTSHRPHELPRNVTHLARIVSGRLETSAGAMRSALGIRDSRIEIRQSRLTAPGIPRFGTDQKPSAESRISNPESQRAAHDPTRRHAIRTSLESRISSLAEVPLVRISNATVYRDYRRVLVNFDWTLVRGEHWAVRGANGSGKSTLLSLIYGDLHPALGGSIERRGVPAGTRIERWKERVGWMSPELQADHFLARSIEEIVVSGRYASVGLNSPMTRADRRAAQPWLAFFGLERLRDRGPRQVSYGQMRLALIARAMVNDPELLLLDEPVTGLDGDLRVFVLAALERLARAGTQIVMAVHDPADMIPSIRHVLTIGRGGKVTLGTRISRQARKAREG